MRQYPKPIFPVEAIIWHPHEGAGIYYITYCHYIPLTSIKWFVDTRNRRTQLPYSPYMALYIYIYITKPCVNSENCLVQVPDPLDIAGASGHLGDVGEPTTVGNGILYNRRRHYAKGGKRH